MAKATEGIATRLVARTGPLAWAVAGLLVIQCIALLQHRGPSPLSSDAPADVFSAGRGISVLQKLLGDQAPHPADSEANRLVRERLISELQGLGLEIEVIEARLTGRPLTLYNVLARLPGGDDRRRPLVLATHYDSVAQGPGAGDAGASLAALLETARVLQRFGEPARPIYFLFSDGEELGMLGAREFVASHPLSRQSPWLLNFDGRGAAGASLMYETHAGNLEWIRFSLRHLAPPRITGSSFVTVYRVLPNNTDFSVYRNSGWQGLNFAFIGDAYRYHQASDRIENLSRRTVQHHGEHATALARALGWSEIDDLSADQDAIFFDILGFYVVAYPASWGAPIAWLMLVLLVLLGMGQLRQRSTWAGILWTLLATLAAATSASAACWLIGWVLSAVGILNQRFVSSGWLIHLAYVAVAGVCLWGVAGTLRRAAAETVWLSVWLGWGIVHLAVAILVPGMSYLFLLPCLVGVVLSLRRWDRRWTAAVATVACGVVLVPTLNLLAASFGPGYGMVLGGLICASLSPLYPLLAK